MPKEDTLPKLLLRDYYKWGDKKIALKKKKFGIWQEYTWKDYYENVKYLSLGLVALGLQRGDAMSIIGDNDPEWWFCELAVQAAGGIAVGLYIDCIPDEIKYIASHSESSFAAAKDQEQCDKWLAIKEELPNLKRVIYWEDKGMWKYDDPILISFDEVKELGKRYAESHPSSFEQMVELGKGSDPAIYCYTSGTTGLPKGAIITYNNILCANEVGFAFNPWYESDHYVSFLSPAWIAEQALGIAAPLQRGCVTCFLEEPETVQENVREIAPEVLFYGSRQWEDIVSQVQVKIIESSAINRFIYNLLMPVGFKVSDAYYEGLSLSFFWKCLYKISDWLLFRPLRDKMGLSNVRIAWVGGSMLGPDIFRYFHAIGVNLLNLYGLSEGCWLTCQRPTDVNKESAGRPTVTTEIRISDEGEILARSGNVFPGYYKDSEATRTRLISGWLHTGDAGFIDEDGHLHFIERVKDMMVLSTGARFSPSYIETRLKFSPYIKDAMVVGQGEAFVAVIINIDFDNVGKWAERNHISYTTFVDLSQRPEVLDLIQKEVAKVNRYLPEQARAKKFANLHKMFDPDEAELTRTRKLRRAFMAERYRELIYGIYGNKDEVPMQTEVKYRDGRKGIVQTMVKIRSVE